jgi:hypothetical protein
MSAAAKITKCQNNRIFFPSDGRSTFIISIYIVDVRGKREIKTAIMQKSRRVAGIWKRENENRGGWRSSCSLGRKSSTKIEK